MQSRFTAPMNGVLVAVVAAALAAGGLPACARDEPDGSAAGTGARVERGATAATESGRVRVAVLYGGEPRQKTSAVVRDQAHCGATIAKPVVEVGAGGALRNAVVSIDDVARGGPIDSTRGAVLDNRGCRFVPHVQSMAVGQRLEIQNSDPILHNTHAYSGPKTVFNIALPIQGQKVEKKLTEPSVLHIQCDAGHTWMEAWIHVFPHPYHGVTGEEGTVEIDGVPAGSYHVRVWHEELGIETLPVRVEAGETVEVTSRQLSRPAAG